MMRTRSGQKGFMCEEAVFWSINVFWSRVFGEGNLSFHYSDSDEENGDVTMYQSMSPSLSSLKRGRQMPNTVVGISWPIGIAPGITFLAHIIAHILLMMMMRRKTTVMMMMMTTMRRRTTVMIMVIAF